MNIFNSIFEEKGIKSFNIINSSFNNQQQTKLKTYPENLRF